MQESFKAFVCWNEEMINRVMDPDALEIPEHVFSATHHPIKMYKETATDRMVSSKIEYDEEAFLKDFLKPEHYIFSAILGDAGTGKTHLIRWLYSQLPSTKDRRVILIPRSGTNLKRILESILEGMEGLKFDQYRQKLTFASENLTLGKARETLLYNIAMAIGPNGSHKMQNLTEEEEYFVDALPALFQDVFFREILLKDGQIIDRLVEHILGNNEKTERLENRREFTTADLPLNLRDINKASAGAQEIYGALSDDHDLKLAAIKWINKNLNEAISQMLSFRGADLGNLMTDIREELGKQDIELVIMIEDFAMLQGIDYQLLDALLVRPNQHSRKLCNLRVAMACTSGYFQTLPDTVQHRVELRVNLDVEAGESLFTKADMEQFVGRYMNALRYHDSALISWHEKNIESETMEILPSKCTDCPFIETCHPSFGSTNEYGLYPFNADAIHVMYQRLAKTDSPNFNPRILIKDVLKHTLANYGHHIKEGTFPPQALINHFGGTAKKRFSAITYNKLQSLDPINTDRREVLLELWSTTKDIINLKSGIHEAFDLPLLQLGSEEISPEPPEVNVEPTPIRPVKVDTDPGKGGTATVTTVTADPVSKLPVQLQEKVDMVNKWKNGEPLQQTLGQELREHLYEAINANIDWNTELLSQSWFTKSLWKGRCINFENQVAMTTKTHIQLILPQKPEELTDTSIVLTGILLYKHHKNWNFEDGRLYFRYFARYIEKWSQSVLEQLKNIKENETERFNPVPLIVDVFAVRAAMNGQLGSELFSQQLNGLLEKVSEASLFHSDEWKKIQKDIKDVQSELEDMLMARIGCAKGESKEYKVIDSFQIMLPLQKVISSGSLTQDTKTDLAEYKNLKKIYQNLQKGLSSFVEKEKNEKTQMLAMIRAALGDDVNIIEFKNEIKKAIDTAVLEGSYAGPDRSMLLQKLNQLDEVLLRKCIADLETLSDSSNQLDLLNHLGEMDQGTLSRILAFLQEVGQFLQKTTGKVNQDIADLSQQQDIHQLEQLKKEMEDSFKDLNNMLDVMQGSETHAK